MAINRAEAEWEKSLRSKLSINLEKKKRGRKGEHE